MIEYVLLSQANRKQVKLRIVGFYLFSILTTDTVFIQGLFNL